MTHSASSEPSSSADSTAADWASECRSVLSVRTLPEYARLGPVRDRRLTAMMAAQQVALAASSRRVAVDGRAVNLDLRLPTATDVREAITRAMSDGFPEVHMYISDVDVDALPPLARYEAATRGGAVMRSPGANAEVDAIVGELARSFAARITGTQIGTGTVPAGAPTLGTAGDRVVVFALDRPVTITSRSDPHGPVATETIEPSTGLLVRRLESIQAADGGAWLAVGVRPFDEAAAWQVAATKAGWWPVLRLDVPYDIESPAEVYGYDDAVEPDDFLRAEIERMLSDETLAEARAQWSAQLAPSRVPVGSLLAVTRPADTWGDIGLGGALVGLPAEPIGTEVGGDFATFAAGGWEVTVHGHVTPLLPILAAGSVTTCDELETECPVGDPLCAHRFVHHMVVLGLLEATPPEDSATPHSRNDVR